MISYREEATATVREIVAECELTKKMSSQNLRDFAQLVLYKHGLMKGNLLFN